MKIGSHVSMSGSAMYEGSVLETLSYGANCFMVYTGAPQNTIRRSIENLKIVEASHLMDINKLDFNDVVIHAPYIINLANPDPEKREFAVNFLVKEVERSFAMHATQIVLHPGSAVGKDRVQALKWIAEGVQKVIDLTPQTNVRIALETMAGKGNEMGKTFEELKEMIDLIDRKHRVSVCFDTCHTHDAGYDIKDDVDGVLALFDSIIGKEYISVFHVNDSKNVRGAAKDRHANFGFGEIGFNPLYRVCTHPDFKEIPKILETPYVDGKPPYLHEINMIKLGVFNPNLIEEIKNS